MKGIDENQSDNEREKVMYLIKNFPDPYDYVVGFHCVSPSSENKKTYTQGQAA